MVNKVILIGNLGHDPELKEFQNGGAICNLSVATSESYKDKNGEWQQSTEWHRVSVRGGGAARAAQLAKGMKVYVEGKIQSRKYTAQDGVERTIYEIATWGVKSMEKRQESAYFDPQATHAPTSDTGGQYDNEDSLPF